MKVQKINKGFTLIELLVVITIIGILATGGMAVYTSQIQRARDATRLQDASALKSGVEMIYQDKAEYPASDATFAQDIEQYIQKLPIDPKHGSTCNQNGTGTTVACAYAYRPGPDVNGIDFGSFEISTAFENTGNITAKAENDGGEDDLRQEVGLLKTDIAKNDIVTVTAASAVGSGDKGVCNVGGTGTEQILIIAGNPTDNTTALATCGGSST